MVASSFEFSRLFDVLGRQINDPAVVSMLKGYETEAYADRSWVELKADGVSVMFKESSGSEQLPKQVVVNAVHLHSEGYKGYRGYKGTLPGQAQFGDSEVAITRKLGPPLAEGGPGRGKVVARIPRWLRYPLDRGFLHLQFDEERKLELVSIYLSVPGASDAVGQSKKN